MAPLRPLTLLFTCAEREAFKQRPKEVYLRESCYRGVRYNSLLGFVGIPRVTTGLRVVGPNEIVGFNTPVHEPDALLYSPLKQVFDENLPQHVITITLQTATLTFSSLAFILLITKYRIEPLLLAISSIL